MRKRTVIIGAIGSLLVGLAVGMLGKGREFTLSIAVSYPESEVHVLLDGVQTGSVSAGASMSHPFRAGVGTQIACRLQAEYFEPKDTVLIVPEVGDIVMADIRLVPAQMELALSITVQEESEAPIPDALISLDGAPTGSSDGSGQWSDRVSRPYGTALGVSVAGIPDAQTVEFDGSPEATLVFKRPSGLPVVIKAAHGVSGVEVRAAGVRLGQTDDEGRLQTSVPFATAGVEVSFSLSGARIAPWTITPRQMAGRKALEHEIRVEPLERPQVIVTAVYGDNPEKPVAGYDVQINGKKAGITKSDGTFSGELRALVGERISVRVASGSEGVGRASTRIVAGQRDHAIRVVVRVPKIIRLTVVDDKTRPMQGVAVRLGADRVGTTDAKGMVDCPVPQLNAEYKLTLTKTGYLTSKKEPVKESGGPAVIKPETVLTERRVEMEPLYFMATFLDSLTGDPAMDIEVRKGSATLATTQGIPVRISIEKLGKQTLEMRSSEARYPTSQKRTVNVTENGQRMKVDVPPRPVTVELTFKWQSNDRPVRDMQVQFTGEGLGLPPRTTDKSGKVTFASHAIQVGKQYAAKLTVGAGAMSFSVVPSSYMFTKSIAVELVASLKVCAMEGQESAVFRLYDKKLDVVLGNPPMAEGKGCIEAGGLSYGEYFLVAQGEASIERLIVIDSPLYEDTWNTSDPFARAEKLRESGNLDQAAELYQQVEHDHPQYSDAQKQLGFYRLANKQFSEAYTAFENAIGVDGHAVDPYMYLAGAQSAHAVRDWDKCIGWSNEAFKYHSMFGSGEKQQKRTHALYVQSLCYHDRFFDTNRPKGECSEERNRLRAAIAKWEQYTADARAEGQDLRDSEQLLTTLKAEYLSMDCE